MENKKYTWKDFEFFKKDLTIFFNPYVRTTADDAIKEYVYSHYGETSPEVINKIIHVLFTESFENLPLYVNAEIQVNPHVKVLLWRAAQWRLKIGK